MNLNNGTCLCLICEAKLTVMKEYNIRRHYERRHSDLIIIDRQAEYLKLKANHQSMQSTLRLNLNESQIVTAVSFQIVRTLME